MLILVIPLYNQLNIFTVNNLIKQKEHKRTQEAPIHARQPIEVDGMIVLNMKTSINHN